MTDPFGSFQMNLSLLMTVKQRISRVFAGTQSPLDQECYRIIIMIFSQSKKKVLDKEETIGMKKWKELTVL